jgi:hypothetical protein
LPSIPLFLLAATSGAGAVSAQATAYVDAGAGPIAAGEEALASATVDATLAQGSIPLAESFHEAGFEVYVGGQLVPLEKMLGKLEVDTQLDRQLNTWTFTTALVTPDGVFGNPLARGGPPTGLLDIDIFACYKVNGQVVRYPLMLHGIAATVKRYAELSRSSKIGLREELSGLDRGGRFDSMPGTLVIPAGSNLRRDQVVALLIGSAFDELSAPDLWFNFEGGNPVNKYVPMIDGDPWQLGGEMFALEGRKLLRDRLGFNWNPVEGTVNNQDAIQAFVLDERLILNAQRFEADGPPGKIPTSVVLTGTQQLTAAPTPSPAHKISSQREVTIASYAPKVAAGEQQVSGAIASIGFSASAPTERPILVVVTTRDVLGSTLVRQTVETYSYVWPEAARYQWNEGTHHEDALVCFVPPGAIAGDSAGAFATPTEQFLLSSRVTTEYFYDGIGYTGPEGLPTDPWFKGLSGTATGFLAGTGLFLGSVTTTESYYMRRGALKVASGATPWQAIDPTNGILLRGSGEAVFDAAASLMTTRKDYLVTKADANGHVATETTYSYGFGLYQGGKYLYTANNQQSSQQEETFELVGITQTAYFPNSETGFTKVQSTFNFDGSSTQQVGNPVIVLGQGAPPAVEKLPNYTPDEIAFPAGQTADPNQTQPMKVTINAYGLLANHPAYKLKTTLQWAETPQELANAGLHIIEQAAADPVTVTTPLLGMLYAGMWLLLRYRPLGIDNLAQISQAKHWTNGEATDPRYSTFVCKIFPQTGAVVVPEIGTGS